jgi:putative ABC transport system substrate-binding protein
MLVAFRRGLAQAGLIEGRDVVLAIHYLDGDFGRLPPLAEAMVAARHRVIVTAPTTIVAGLRRATATIPIVMVSVGDPVGAGLAVSLARPGGNVTGLSNLSADLVEKQFSFVLQLLPRTRRVLGLRGAQPGVVYERMDAAFVGVAERSGIAARVVLLDERPDIEKLRAAITAEPPDALFVLADPIALARRRAIVAAADAAKLPIVAPFREFPEAGALASYGSSVAHAWERAANYVDRILKGANPAEMPIEQPTRFELAINLKTARALGLTIPELVLAVADEIIE